MSPQRRERFSESLIFQLTSSLYLIVGYVFMLKNSTPISPVIGLLVFKSILGSINGSINNS